MKENRIEGNETRKKLRLEKEEKMKSKEEREEGRRQEW